MKKCFKCGIEKQFEEFYKHSRMSDGRLGKCIICAKADSMSRLEIKKQSPEWMKQERERCREKQERYRKSGMAKIHPAAGKNWEKRNRHKRLSQGRAGRAVKRGLIKKKTSCENCGVTNVRIEKHHPDYSKPLEVQFLCTKCHGITRRKDQ